MRIACVQLRAREATEADRALGEAVDAASDACKMAELVVLPEATYPAYILHDRSRYLDPRWYERGSAAFSEIAAREGGWVAVGLVRPDGDRLLNSAVLFDPTGRAVTVTDKTFLWHFDRRWFHAGRPGEVTALPWGPTGMFVCADARMAEVPRRLAVDGARLLLDPTALVLSPGGSNAQVEYMLSARAWENGAFLAVANKCGSEARFVRYAGRSAIFGPDGTRLAEAGSDDPQIITADVDLASAAGPPVARAPEGYRELTQPLDSLPITEVLAQGPPAETFRMALVSEGAAEQALLREMDADVAVGVDVVPGARVFAVRNGGFTSATGDLPSGATVAIGAVRLGVLAGDRGLVPEEVRVLMLHGASVVLWSTATLEVPDAVARTRADENRVFLVTIAGDGAWRVFGPSGGLLAEGPRHGMAAALVELPVALAWSKEVVPGTDVVRGRLPDLYGALA